MDRTKLTQENILDAMRIYHEEAFGEEYFEREEDLLSYYAEGVVRELSGRPNNLEYRFGFPGWMHAKMRLTSYRSMMKDEGFEYAVQVDTNDWGVEQDENSELKEKIENRWKEEGYSVY